MLFFHGNCTLLPPHHQSFFSGICFGSVVVAFSPQNSPEEKLFSLHLKLSKLSKTNLGEYFTIFWNIRDLEAQKRLPWLPWECLAAWACFWEVGPDSGFSPCSAEEWGQCQYRWVKWLLGGMVRVCETLLTGTSPVCHSKMLGLF